MFFAKKAKLPCYKNANFSSIFKEIMSKKIPIWKKKIQDVKKEHGTKELSKIKFGQVLHGMQGISTMFYTASILHPKIVLYYFSSYKLKKNTLHIFLKISSFFLKLFKKGSHISRLFNRRSSRVPTKG